MTMMDWEAFWPPMLLSLRVALIASLLAVAAGVSAAKWMVKRSFKGRTLLETVFMLPLVLPPTVVGFVLLMALGRRSWLGQAAEWLLASPIVFTWWAAVAASAIVAFPLVYQTMKAGFASVDASLEEAARSAGANEWQVFAYITFPLAFRSFAAACILGFARGFGEFGATLMIAGNIPGQTQTAPTAIYLAVGTGNMALAWALTASMIGVSFLLLWLTRLPASK